MSSGNKRKFVFSQGLTTKLLDLAGVKGLDVSKGVPPGECEPEKKKKVKLSLQEELDGLEVAPITFDASSLQREGAKIKHQADKLPDSRIQLILYIRAGLRFLERISKLQEAEAESRTISLAFLETAQFFQTCGFKCRSSSVENIDPLAFTCFRLSSLCYMQRFNMVKHKVDKLYMHRKKKKIQTTEEVNEQLDYVFQENQSVVIALGLNDKVAKLDLNGDVGEILKKLMPLDLSNGVLKRIPELAAKVRVILKSSS